jgi:hypothetical protein
MGGSGSGRWGSRRPLAEAMRRIDLAQLRRSYPITPDGLVRMSYAWARGRHVDATVSLLHTPLHFGGWSVWFCCPSCGRRCRVLYGSWRIACRHCHRLRYLSQRETPSGRANLGMLKVAKRLDPEARGNALPFKPKGMHWSTYERLSERYDAYSTMWAMSVMRYFRIRRR